MIRKQYKPDGSPDLRRWTVECDACTAAEELTCAGDWVIPSGITMPDYCPFCAAIIAAYLIEAAFPG